MVQPSFRMGTWPRHGCVSIAADYGWMPDAANLGSR